MFIYVGITGFQKQFKPFDTDKLTTFNVCKFAALAKEANADKLKNRCLEFMLECHEKNQAFGDLDILPEEIKTALLKSLLLTSKAVMTKQSKRRKVYEVISYFVL